MGKRKRQMELIENKRERQIAFYKRKKGLFKKAMELSHMCHSKVFLSIINKNNHMEIFSSHPNENDECLKMYLEGKVKAKKLKLSDVC
jgi:hypothetical protein